MFFHVILPLSGGLFIFLGGMKLMEAALRQLGGPLLSKWLNRATASPWKGLLFSSGLTALLQSSTAVTVLTIGLVNAGLLTYGRTLGIILGTNVGTVVTTELLGLQLGRWAMPLLGVSLLSWAVSVMLVERGAPFRASPPRRLLAFQYACLACSGFALLLGGIQLMQTTGPWVRDAGVFRWFLEHSEDSMWWAFAAGACLTAIIHSSAAVIGTAISLAAAGALPVDVGIGIVIGSNVGTCVTALIAALGGSRAGHFVAWSHTGLNIAGALLFMPFINGLEQAAAWMSSGPGTQIAHAQTLFNLICSLAVLPICYLPVWERMGSSPPAQPTVR
ncbi:Na/Pi symporter [Paenibacillus sp. P96]|uniref:Na/Pi symporter n=1 Tax=Paenibacillus zeirhizosphaerae TaxID=2987519 RepID=A0ABT9FQH6_9BACL|nr:Na/Pi symporter [Paenibacillus sp. P96]MDP4096998.1 Na/Pi symporter [Paenibacillus sp. P96]